MANNDFKNLGDNRSTVTVKIDKIHDNEILTLCGPTDSCSH